MRNVIATLVLVGALTLTLAGCKKKPAETTPATTDTTQTTIQPDTTQTTDTTTHDTATVQDTTK